MSLVQHQSMLNHTLPFHIIFHLSRINSSMTTLSKPEICKAREIHCIQKVIYRSLFAFTVTNKIAECLEMENSSSLYHKEINPNLTRLSTVKIFYKTIMHHPKDITLHMALSNGKLNDFFPLMSYPLHHVRTVFACAAFSRVSFDTELQFASPGEDCTHKTKGAILAPEKEPWSVNNLKRHFWGFGGPRWDSPFIFFKIGLHVHN